jgi:preprotein translocase subunit SecA
VITPTLDYRRTGHRVPERPLQGLDARVDTLYGVYKRRGSILAELTRQAEEVDAQSRKWKELSNQELHDRLMEFREQFRRGGKNVPDLLVPSLAALREASDRFLGLRPFVVQLVGALAMHRGYLAEMATGEGKTLTAGLAAALAAWTRQPCHIITVNDYLVERDAQWLEPFYKFCGVRVGCVAAWMGPPERHKGYGCDVTYTTSKELLADFLRDRLRVGAMRQPTRRLIRRMLAPQASNYDGLVLRGLHTAIVDEADSILIDEAVTPLIISTTHQNDALRQASEVAAEMAAILMPGVDYRVDLRYKEIEITPAGRDRIAARSATLDGLWHGFGRRTELLRDALVAREFFHRDKQYIVEGEKIVIVDEFTGRPMPQRTWRQGMHQAIEAKEGLTVTDPSETIARLSFQRFFRCFHKLSGMTGTAREAAGEFWQTYRLPVVTIPPNRPCIREQWSDRVFAFEKDKWNAIADEAVRLHATGRPLLIGTRSVASSERLASMLERRAVDFRLLNAIRLHEEASIVALAGERGHITIATNMAGRGTDIKLGPGVKELGGLHVIATERHESGRVDRQLFGRAARQGDPGSAQAFISAEDELMRRYLPLPLQQSLHKVVATEMPGSSSITRLAITIAQRKAQRLAAAQRRGVLRTDNWLEEALSFAGVEGV